MLLRLIYRAALSGFIMLLSLENAFEAFGFKSGISKKQAESKIIEYALGDIQWMGKSSDPSLSSRNTIILSLFLIFATIASLMLVNHSPEILRSYLALLT